MLLQDLTKQDSPSVITAKFRASGGTQYDIIVNETIHRSETQTLYKCTNPKGVNAAGKELLLHVRFDEEGNFEHCYHPQVVETTSFTK